MSRDDPPPRPPAPGTAAAARPTIRDVLARVHFRVTLFAVGMAGITVLLAGLIVMRSYALHNFALVAQAASYTVEAAVVFDDRTAAAEAIAPLADTEGVAELAVLTARGETLAIVRRNASGIRFAIERALGRIAFPGPVVVPIRHQGETIGRIRLRGDASGLLRFALSGLAGMIACLIATAIAARLLARHLQKSVVAPLRAIAAVAHEVRAGRNFTRRAPPAPIAEIAALGEDFNALLGELEAWDAHLRTENATLSHRATHDPLTGLANRAQFEAQLGRTLDAAAIAGERIALLYLDGNHFKDVNDRHGHAAGDAVLIETAARIEGRLRSGDLAARIGGDEFAVLLAAPAAEAEARGIARAIGAAMAAPIDLPDGAPLLSSLSIGIALFPDHGTDAAALIRHADAAMYADKHRVHPSA